MNPYERVQPMHDIRALSGRIQLNADGRDIVASVLGGTAQIDLIEEFDEFRLYEPGRMLAPRRRLRLLVEADLDQMTVTVQPSGNGEAVTSPDSRHRF